MTEPREELFVDDRYYILASSVAGDLPKLVLKHDDAFLVADRRGDLPALPDSEFGFYVEGTRFLRQLELRLHDRRPLLLDATLAHEGVEGAIDLTNPDIAPDGERPLPGRTVRIGRQLLLHDNTLYQRLVIESFAREAHEVDLAWHFGADFVDVFEVRGHARRRRGLLLPARVEGAAIELAYQGLDGVRRTTRMHFEPPPDALDDGSARYRLRLLPAGRVELLVSASAAIGLAPGPERRGWGEALTRRTAVVEQLRRDAARIVSDQEPFNAWLAQARDDLHVLLTATDTGFIPYAGIPWYVAPFGRDSVLAALQVLPYEPEVARGTLRFLARHQGREDDPFTDQEPGKILHEYRRGELAACREIPFVPYYGSVDASPLYVMLLGEYVRWTADRETLAELWPTVEAAMAWMAAAEGPGGFLRYQRRSPLGLDNQGWKDSHDAVMHASGELAKPPVALVEVQGYYYAALGSAADLARTLGHARLATRWRRKAERLRARLDHEFWLEEHAFHALALDGTGTACRVITSNPGHCLWTRAVPAERAGAVVKRLVADDVFTGWGLRTLAAGERLYNPMSYHNGSVWPHDTAIAALGMRYYGFVEPFLALATGLYDAALHVDDRRLPELFCGFARRPGHGPTRYPSACSPQAWSAGVVFQLVTGFLGLAPDAPDNRLTLYRPRLPSWLAWLEVHGLRLGRSRLSLRVTQGREAAAVELLERQGDAELVVRR